MSWENITIEDLEEPIFDTAENMSRGYATDIVKLFRDMGKKNWKIFLTIGAELLNEISFHNWNDQDQAHMIELMVVVMYLSLTRPELKITDLQTDGLSQKVLNSLATFFFKIKQANERIRKQKIKDAKEKHKKQQETARERALAAIKIQKEKEKNRKKNKFCKNETEFFTMEDIEDIPTEELTFIKFNESIFCLDNGSYVNMLKHSDSQKVRGDCKPPIRNRPLQCKNFYPINIGSNIFINEKNYEKRLKETKNKKQKRKFILKNKKRINFTTGLHIVGQKTGWDDVYDLEPANYPIGNSPQSARKVSKSKEKIFRKYTVKQLKAECKKKGIKGYSKLKKTELILHCSVTDEISSAPKKAKKTKITVKQLRQQCKKLKIKGYSKWKKAELMKNCNK